MAVVVTTLLAGCTSTGTPSGDQRAGLRPVVLPDLSRLEESVQVQMRERYESRITIFDLPPLLSSDDAITLLPKFDCVLLVVANGMNSKKDIEDSLYHLGTSNLIGTVLNKAEEQPRTYY